MICDRVTHCCAHHCFCNIRTPIPAEFALRCCCAPPPKSLRERIQPQPDAPISLIRR